MSGLRRVLLVSTLVVGVVTEADAQWNAVSPFAGGAIFMGAQGFARPPITSAVVGAYAHTPVRAALIGGQIATTFAEPRRSHASYAVATVAYAQRRVFSLQMYPYLALGSAAFRTQADDARWRPAFGGGFGIDALTGNASRGLMLGARVGYLTRSMSDDESIAFAAIGFGFGSRHQAGEHPRAVVARSSIP
jgi:hypothetical protein